MRIEQPLVYLLLGGIIGLLLGVYKDVEGINEKLDQCIERLGAKP